MNDFDDDLFDAEPLDRGDDAHDELYEDEPLVRDDDHDDLYEEEFTPVTRDEEFDNELDETVAVDLNQHMLLSYLNSNHALWTKCSPIIKDEYFSNDLITVFQMIKEYEIKNQQLPNKLVVLADTGISLETPDDAQDDVVLEDISDRVETFCRHRATANLLEESYDIIQKDSSRTAMEIILGEMTKVTQISIQQDMGYEVHDDAAKLLAIAEKSDALPTGFELLDNALGGGVTNPSYNIVSAASGQGKSIYLQNISVNYCRQGHNVVYISLELPEFMIEKRYAAMMTDTDINQIYPNLDIIIAKMKQAKRKEGKIRIKRLPMNGTSMAEIKAYVAELKSQTGEKWEHIMLDYPDLMEPMTQDIKLDNIHARDQAVSVDIYDWTHEKGSTKTVWGASQQVKGAKDEKDARQSGVAGGVGKVNTCDNLVILKRTRDDIQDERCWAYIEKGRNGGQGLRIPFNWDIKTQRMDSPLTLQDLFDEANSPANQEEKKKPPEKKRFGTDPMVKASARANTPSGQKVSSTMRMIKERTAVGKAK